MDDEKLANLLERSIPSYIKKVEKGELSPVQAARYFNSQLKRLKDRQRALVLQNEFHRRLKNLRASVQGPALIEIAQPQTPEIIIDGPFSIGANHLALFSAQTKGLDAPEDYIWETEGEPEGVSHESSNSSGDLSHNFAVKTSADCKSGMLCLTAKGTESGGRGAIFVEIIGAQGADNEEKKPEEKKQDTASSDAEIGEPSDQTAEKKTDETQADKEQKKQNFLQKWFADKAQKALGNYLKKFLTKEFWVAVWAFIGTNWYWLLLLVLIAIAGIAIYAGLTSQASSGAAGSTIHQEVDLVNDTNLVEKTLLATGDNDARAAVINKTFPGIQKQLLALKDSADGATKVKIDETSTKIDQYMSNNDPALGKEIVASVKEIMATFDLQAPVIKTQTRAPLDKITDYNFNLHYGTPLNKEMPKNGGHTTYMYQGEGRADAVDLYTDEGSSVFPAFAGKIVDLSNDGAGHKKVVIENGDYQMLYANFDSIKGLVLGQTVSIDTPIGKVVSIEGQTQVHIELAYQGKSLVTTPLDQIDFKESNKPWGQYLWEHMKKVLNLK